MADRKKNYSRCTGRQKEELIKFMAQHHKELAQCKGKLTGPLGDQRATTLWNSLKEHLTEYGPDKTVEQWKITWRDLKKRTRQQNAQIRCARAQTGNLIPIPMIQQNAQISCAGAQTGNLIPIPMILTTIGKEDSSQTVGPWNFNLVREICVALIKECGRPLEMLDDEPFRQLINMIVKKEGDRQQLTAAAIKSYIEINCDEGDDDDAEQDMNEEEVDSDDGAVEEYEVPIPSQEIKGEVMSCTCQLRDDGNGHDSNCPLNCVPYWEYFEVSTNEAKCKECRKLITWTMMTDLKTHLVVFHPKISFKDDDDNYEEDHNASSEISYQGQKEVFVDNMATLKPEPAAKKRKLPPSTKPVFVALRDSEKICLDRFKSLDRFGLYVASLLKLLPEQKSIKYQEQIINRLLKEQPAAG